MDLQTLRKVAAALFCAGAAVLFAGCGGADGTLTVGEPRAHLMPATGQGAVYLEIRNGTGRDDRLLRIETEVAKVAEIHETFEDGGVIRMRAFPEGLEIPAGGTVVFEPGGKHVMLISPEPDADGVPLTLVFEHAGRVSIRAPRVDLGR